MFYDGWLGYSEAVPQEADSLGTYYPKARTDVKTKDGHLYTCTIEKRKGSPGNPLTVDEVKTKFLDCACLAISEDLAASIADTVMDMEHIDDIGRLIRMMVNT